MGKKVYTGDNFLDKLLDGGVTRNPEYNPKTKAGKLQPPVLVDNTPGSTDEGIINRYTSSTNRLRFTNKDLGLNIEDVEKDKEAGISISPFNTNEELNLARWNNQSGLEQTGNALMQAGVGEVILGTLEGFGNIADGIINTFTGDQYGVNPYTQIMAEAKEKLKEDYKIYTKNPDGNFSMLDWGWWMNGFVNIATIVSLMLPAAGWARGIGMLGKIGNVGQKAARFTSRALSRVGKASKDVNKFNSLRNAVSKANRMERSIMDNTSLIGTAALSRAGENFMEAKEVYNNVYNTSLENLTNMPDKEFTKFIKNNPEFVNEDGTIMSKEDIAKEIARKSANTTFYNDYAMLLMDIPQFKAIGKLWGNVGRRSTTAAERIAAKNSRLSLAGKSGDDLIKDNIWNRTKEGFKYALKNPAKSLSAMELGEGFEEIYQGIQTEKGMETATKYFDPTFTPRSLQSYLADASIWEQGFWGVIGGITFNKLSTGIRTASKKIEGVWNKKHMSAEDYERWKRSNDKIGIEQLNNIQAKANDYIENMKAIAEGKNPFKFVVDPTTGMVVLKNGEMQEESIDESQKDLLREKALDDFIANATFDAMDSGIFDLMKEVITSEEFNQYIANNGLQINTADKNLQQEVASRMEELADMYQNELNNVHNLADTTNPFIEIAVARNIVRNKLNLQDYENTINNIEKRIAELNTSNENYTNYLETLRYNNAKRQIKYLQQRERQVATDYAKGEISKNAYEISKEYYKNKINEWTNYLSTHTTKGSLEVLKQTIADSSKSMPDVYNAFDDFIKEYEELVKDETSSTPPESIADLFNQQVVMETRRNYTVSDIPVNQKDYENLYNEFSRGMDAMETARRDDYLKTIEKYLDGVDNVDEAITNLLQGNVNNKKLKDSFTYLRYGYVNPKGQESKGDTEQLLTNIMLDDIFDKARKKEEDKRKLQEEAARENIPLPEPDEAEVESPPSTGEEIIANPAAPAAPANPNQTTPPVEGTSTVNSSEPVPTREPEPIVPKTTGHEGEEDPTAVTLTREEEETQRIMAEGQNTPAVKADLDVRKYVTMIGFKEEGRINDITRALEAGDTSKLLSFIKEVTDFLISRGYDPTLASVIAKKSTAATINLFGSLNEKSAFGKLAHQLALGFSKESAQKHAITELVDGQQLPNIIEKFLEIYNEAVKATPVDGKYIVNLQTLFDLLINEQEIDVNTAILIYDNIGQYIARHDGSKYIFTGFDTTRGLVLSGEGFINRLRQQKAQVVASMKMLHINPLEVEQRDKNYSEALTEAHNGAKTYVVPQYDRFGGLSNLEVYVEYKKGNRAKKVKIGILRSVKYSEDGNIIDTYHHNSGFRNTATKHKDDTITLGSDKLFESIINRETDEAKQLFNDIATYYLAVQDIINKVRRKEISQKEASKELKKILDKETAERILSNPLIQDVIHNGQYVFKEDEVFDSITRARDIAKRISSILFFGKEENISDPTNREINTFAADSKTLSERYEMWKQEVWANYEHTYKLQKAVESGTENPRIEINITYNTTLNTVEKGEPFTNVSDLQVNLDPNKSDKDMPYIPFVFNRNGHMIDEYGNDYGAAPFGIGEYSMGYLVYNEDGLKYYAFCERSVDMTKSELAENIKAEFRNIILTQFNNLNPSTHEDTFLEIRDRIEELFGKGGLFWFNGINVLYNETIGTVSICRPNPNPKTPKDKYIPIMTFHRNNIDNSNSTAITIFNKDGSHKAIKDVNGNQQLLDSAIEEIFKEVYINRSSVGFTKETKSGGTPKLFTWDGNKFILHLGGKDYEYRSYGDFITQTGGFTTHVKQVNGSFVTRRAYENKITADTEITKDIGDVKTNTAVTDLLYKPDGTVRRKNIDVQDLLSAAQVEQEKIDVLLGTNSGMPIANKTISVYTGDSESRQDSFMFYDNKEKKIYITAKGATALNSNPTNAIRLLLHENLHRLFASNKFTNAERIRIINELKEVKEFVKQQIESDYASGKLNQSLRDAFNSIIAKTESYENEQTQIEEFLVETLTQPKLVEYLNNTEYGADADIKGINQKKKSIFQKIIDILLDLLGIKEDNIKNNSILAREYVILSKGTTTTVGLGELNKQSNSTANQPIERKPIKPKVEENNLEKTENKVNEVINYFNSRIKRSGNFEEDHTYLIDDVPVDYSVTQLIHGKQDIGAWGVPSSSIGNTADTAARTYFEYDGIIPENVEIANLTEDDRARLIEDLDRLKEYLDKRFGKGKYKVVTEEFPIGGTIEIDGEVKTVAGTMDMLVYTDSGELFIFDFKTSRNNKLSKDKIANYSKQVNIYRQLIEANFPELRGKVHTEGLIPFITEYPSADAPGIKYRNSPNNQKQLQIDKGWGFFDIQDDEEYQAPYFFLNEEISEQIESVEEKDYSDTIKAIPEINRETEVIENTTDISEESQDLGIEDDIYDPLLDNDYEFEDDSFRAAKTELIENSNNSTEIYAPAIADGIADNAYGVVVVNNMNDFIESFPSQYRADIQQILDSNEINYTCK